MNKKNDMSLKDIVLILGSAAILSAPAYPLNRNLPNANTLESRVVQEANAQMSQSQEDQKYAELKKLFDEADYVGFGVADKIPPEKSSFEYNDYYKNICKIYSLKEVTMYKFNRSVLKEPKKYINRDKITNEPKNLLFVFKATMPSDNIPLNVIEEAKKEGLASPVTDNNTPILEEGKEYIFFLKNASARKGTKAGITSYLTASEQNKAQMEKILAEHNLKIGESY
jgi:hypothetical protein